MKTQTLHCAPIFRKKKKSNNEITDVNHSKSSKYYVIINNRRYLYFVIRNSVVFSHLLKDHTVISCCTKNTNSTNQITSAKPLRDDETDRSMPNFFFPRHPATGCQWPTTRNRLFWLRFLARCSPRGWNCVFCIHVGVGTENNFIVLFFFFINCCVLFYN